jgi:leucyl/phenylalanyl-tRNA--protein transferase
MPVTKFPDPKRTSPEGILAIGGDLHPQTLRLAYSQGIFPWPVEDRGEMILAWFCPDPRAILDFKDLHVPRSLQAALKKTKLRFTRDQAFSEVIAACAEAPRPGQRGTWITPELLEAYNELHRHGLAHSVEAWNGPTLVGGIYGVEIQGVVSGESMFYREPNASKLTLLHWIEYLRTHGVEWLDIQMLTPHLKALGAKEISRDEFLSRLKRTHALALKPYP